MILNYYNVNQIVKIAVNDFEESRYFKYRPEKKFLFIITQKAGYYNTWWNLKYRGTELPKNTTLGKQAVFNSLGND
jgi:hypothetical protein